MGLGMGTLSVERGMPAAMETITCLSVNTDFTSVRTTDTYWGFTAKKITSLF